jgi:hypothetical protein
MGIADRLGGNSAAWRPADNKTNKPPHPNPLVGKVVEVTTGTGDYGPYPLLFVLDEKGDEWRVHGFGSVLQSRIAELKPAPGDEIGIKYLGEEPAKAFPGKTYKNFKIVLERASGETDQPDWAAMAKTAEAEANEPF